MSIRDENKTNVRGNLRTVKATPRRWPSAESATSAGRALVPADSPKTFLKSVAATVILAALNSALDTPANFGTSQFLLNAKGLN